MVSPGVLFMPHFIILSCFIHIPWHLHWPLQQPFDIPGWQQLWDIPVVGQQFISMPCWQPFIIISWRTSGGNVLVQLVIRQIPPAIKQRKIKKPTTIKNQEIKAKILPGWSFLDFASNSAPASNVSKEMGKKCMLFRFRPDYSVSGFRHPLYKAVRMKIMPLDKTNITRIGIHSIFFQCTWQNFWDEVCLIVIHHFTSFFIVF